MIYRKPFENGSNPGREREEAVLRGVSRWFEPWEPWVVRRDEFRSRHMGNVASNAKLCAYQFPEGQIVFSGRRQTV
jgi:hypothetical protein